MSGPVNLLYLYAPADEALRGALEAQLAVLSRQGLIEGWHQGCLLPGQAIEPTLALRLQTAEILLILVSADLFASDQAHALLRQALRRHDDERVQLLPVIVRPVAWQDTPIGGLQVLPASGKPVATWPNQDEAWVEVVRAVRRHVERRGLVPPAPNSAPSVNPYRGLAAFHEEHAAFFFGREELTRQLWRALHELHCDEGALRLLTVHGPSGSGKSSVTRAGLLPMLRRQPAPDARPLRVAALTPGEHPVENLALALVPVFPAVPEKSPTALLRQIAQDLWGCGPNGERDGLRLFARTLPGTEETSRSDLVLLVDQFEEVYALCKEDEERDLFIDLLLEAAGARDSHVSIVLTLRSDFFGETHRHPVLNQAIARCQILVPVMSREELRRAIAAPAARQGHALDAAMVDMLLSETEQRQGALPLLEFTLARIWEGWMQGTEPAQTLADLGGVGGALAGEAQRIYAGLRADQRAIARRAFLHMVQLGEGVQDTRRRVPVQVLIGVGEEREQVMEVLRQFARPGTRLVTLSGGPARDEETAELTHEALLQHWELLREWIEQGREDVRFHRRVAEAAARWVEIGRPVGSLWRSPELDLLRDFAGQIGERKTDFVLSEVQDDFLRASIAREEAEAERERQRSLAEQRRMEYERRRLIAEGRRSRALAAGLAVVIVVIGALWWGVRRQGQKAVAESARAQERLVAYYEELGRREWLAGDEMTALVYLSKAYSETRQPSAALLTLLAPIVRRVEARRLVLQGHSGPVTSVAFSPDGRRIVTGSEDQAARVWDAQSGKLLLVVPIHQDHDEVQSVAFSPDGTRIATVGWYLRVWDARNGEASLPPVYMDGIPGIVAFSPDGKQIAGATGDTVRILDAHTGEALSALHTKRHKAFLIQVTAISFSPDGRRLAVASHSHGDGEGGVQVWDIATSRVVFTLHDGEAESVAFSPDGQRILAGLRAKDVEGVIRAWDALTGKEQGTWSGFASSIVFSPDGSTLITTGGGIRVRSATAPAFEILRLQDLWRSVAISPDGRRIVGVTYKNLAAVWDIAGAQTLLAEFESDPDGMTVHVAISPDGGRIVTGSGVAGENVKEKGTARIWDVTTGQELGELRGHRRPVVAVAYGPDGRRVATASMDGTARVWDSSTGQELQRLEGHGKPVHSVSYDPDGSRVFTSGADKTIRVWDSVTGQEIRRIQATAAHMTNSPDGRQLVTGNDRTICLWNAWTGKQLLRLEDVGSHVWWVDHGLGERIAASTFDGTLLVLDARSGEPLLSPLGGGGGLSEVKFSPDGERIFFSGRVLDARTGNLLLKVSGGSGSFSRDGRQLATGTDMGEAKVWEVALDPRSHSPEQVAALARCSAPYRIDLGGRLQEAEPAPRTCPRAIQEETPLMREHASRNLRASARRALHGGRIELAQDFARQALEISRQPGPWREEVKSRLLFCDLARRTGQAEEERRQHALIALPCEAHPSEAAEVLLEHARIEEEELLDPVGALAHLELARALVPDHPGVLAARVEAEFADGQFVRLLADVDAALALQQNAETRTTLAFYAWAAAVLTERPGAQQRASALNREYREWDPDKDGDAQDFAVARRVLLRRPDRSGQLGCVQAVLDFLGQARDASSEGRFHILLRCQAARSHTHPSTNIAL